MHNNIIEITFSDSTKNHNTSDHPYYVKGKGWSSYDAPLASYNYGGTFKSLKEGDVVYKLAEGQLVEIEIMFIQKQKAIPVRTYNLSEIANSNNYFVNGILIHNESLQETGKTEMTKTTINLNE